MRLSPFKALRPAPDAAARVAAPPYDVVTAAEARLLTAGNPHSFLHVTRAEIDMPEEADPASEAVYAQGRRTLDSLRRERVLIEDPAPSLYIYRLELGAHVQHGVAACLDIEDYVRQTIRTHEKTRQDKEDDRARHIRILEANTGPVFLLYRRQPAIDALVESVEQGAPLCAFTAADGVRHAVWRAPDPAALQNAFAAVDVCYIADGHHRAAAAVRVGQERRAANPAHTGREEYTRFLGVLFPDNQLRILPYNRAVHDLNGLSAETFLAAVRERFAVREEAAPAPAAPRRASMYTAGRWYGLAWDTPPGADPVSSLDVSVLQDRLLAPVLGIDDPRTSGRIDFIGGIRGHEELARLVDAGRAAVAFSMYPTTVDQLTAIADAGQMMPPKSTWFEPKLRSGLLVHTL
jgi:uncharacterized protein (DUF1015 family)